MSKRTDYRHTFEAHQRPAVEIAVGGKPPILKGRLVNLSLGGALVEAHDRRGLLNRAGWAILRFEISTGPVEYHCRPVYADAASEPGQFGFRFVRILDPRQNASQERALWGYLLEEQRRQIRHRKAPR